MLTRAWVKDALERALKTAAESLIATLALGTGLLDVDWVTSLSIAGLATVLSLLSSLASAGVGQVGTASLLSLRPRVLCAYTYAVPASPAHAADPAASTP